jgi:hypothetical protein
MRCVKMPYFYANVNRPKVEIQRQRTSGKGFISHASIVQLWDCDTITCHQWSYNRPASKPPAGDTSHNISPKTADLHLPVATCDCISPGYNKVIFTHIYNNLKIYHSFFTPLSKTLTLMGVQSYLPPLRLFSKQKAFSGAYVQRLPILPTPTTSKWSGHCYTTAGIQWYTSSFWFTNLEDVESNVSPDAGGFVGLVVSMLASEPSRGQRIFQLKKSSAYLPSEVK